MPMYEYKCAKCGEVFELIQKFSDEPLHEHPGCGGGVEKLVSAAALKFKGSGWYVNDYGRNGSSGKENRKDKENQKENHKEKAPAASSDTNKSEKAETSKPAAAPAQETSHSNKSE
jgi:putative FmdB family regulatory protein